MSSTAFCISPAGTAGGTRGKRYGPQAGTDFQNGAPDGMLAESMRGTNGSNAFDANDAGIELLRAVGLCHPGWRNLQCVTFTPEGFSTPEWLRWKESLFTEVFLPRIEEARSASAAGNWQSLADCDRAIDSALPSGVRESAFMPAEC